MNMNLPTQLRKSRTMRGDKEVGVTCISYNTENKDSFIIGSEPGAVFKCSMSANGEQPAGKKKKMNSSFFHFPPFFLLFYLILGYLSLGSLIGSLSLFLYLSFTFISRSLTVAHVQYR